MILSSRNRLSILVLASILSAHAWVSAGQESSLWKKPLDKTILSNGLTVFAQNDDSSAITVMQVLIKGGKAAEPAGKDGLAYLTTRLSLEIPDQGKIQTMMSQATHLSLAGRGDYSIITVACLSENLEDTLPLVSEIMRKPLFSGLRIDGIKKMMNRQREVEEDDTSSLAHRMAMENFFNGTAYGLSIYGTEDSLKTIKKDDIESFFRRYFKAGNMVLVVATDLETKDIFSLLEKHFNGFPAGTPPGLEKIHQKIIEKRSKSVTKETLQSWISMAFPMPPVTPRDFIRGQLLENLLGKGLNSRLWSLRSEMKLAYNVNARATQFRDGGVLEAYLETDQAKKTRALEELKKVLDDLYTNGIGEEELAVTKVYYKSTLLRENETKDQRTQTIAEMEALGLGNDFITRIFQEIEAVTIDEMNAFIKSVLDPDKAFELVIGPEGGAGLS